MVHPFVLSSNLDYEYHIYDHNINILISRRSLGYTLVYTGCTIIRSLSSDYYSVSFNVDHLLLNIPREKKTM